MRKQILAVMIGLTVVLSGCAKQGAKNTESTESMLQEVKKDTKEIKSGKVSISMSAKGEKSNSGTNFELSGDEKFEPTEAALKGKFSKNSNEIIVEDYIKDGYYYTKSTVGSKSVWQKSKAPGKNENVFDFKDMSLNMNDEILSLLDNKDNWDISKDGDKVTFKLKKNDDMKAVVQLAYDHAFDNNEIFAEFDYNLEYVYNTKSRNVEKLVYEYNRKRYGSGARVIAKGTLEEINKEVKVVLPEESKSAREVREQHDKYQKYSNTCLRNMFSISSNY